jgi:hypothetical protein
VIHPKAFSLEEQVGKREKDEQGYYLLNNFQLQQAEWTAVLAVSHSIGGNLKTIFKEG